MQTRSVRLMLAAYLAAAATFIQVSAATADIYEGAHIFPAPTQPRSLTPEAPIEQQQAYLHEYGARYDAESGSLAVFFSYYEPEYWASRIEGTGTFPSLPYETFALVPASQGPQITGRIPVRVRNPYGDEPGEVAGGEASLEGFNGSVMAPTLYEDSRYMTIFVNQAFANSSHQAFGLVAEWAAYIREAPEPTVIMLNDVTHPESSPQPPHIMARRASSEQARALTNCLRHYLRAGQYRHALGKLDRLRRIRVTNDGWAEGELYASHPQRYEQTGAQMIFHLAGRWRVVAWGSAPGVGDKSIPAAVLHALDG